MKKIIYFPFVLLAVFAASCSMQTNHTAASTPAITDAIAEKELVAELQIKDTIRSGEPAELNFTVYNRTDSVKKFLKWQTPFEPPFSKYLDIKNDKGEEMLYKGAMAKRMMPPPATAYLVLNPKDSLSAKADILKAYTLNGPGKYTVTYNSEGMSGLKARRSVTFVYQP